MTPLSAAPEQTSRWWGRSQGAFILLLGVAAFLYISLLRLSTSLWLDELITAWIVQGSIAQLLERSFAFQPQGPLYFLLPWAVGHVFGFHEWALRLPSLVANCVTIWLVYRFLSSVAGREFALCGAGIFAVIAADFSVLQEARPYAVALSCFTLSLHLLVRWAFSGKAPNLIAFVVAASLTFYVHFLFAVGFPLYGAVLLCVRRRSVLSVWSLATAAALFLLLILPGLWHLWSVSGSASLYFVSGPPSFGQWLAATFRDQSTLLLVGLVVLVVLTCREALQTFLPELKDVSLLGLILWFYPALAAATITYGTGVPIFLPRYLSYSLIGETIVQATALYSVRSHVHRAAVFATVIVFSLTSRYGSPTPEQDWRGALAAVSERSQPSERSVVLMWSGIVETRDLSWTTRAEHRAYLNSPVNYYRVLQNTIPLPLHPEHFAPEEIFAKKELELLRDARRIFIVTLPHMPFITGFRGHEVWHRVPWLDPHRSFDVVSVTRTEGVVVFALAPKP